jgi:hypothetical protein
MVYPSTNEVTMGLVMFNDAHTTVILACDTCRKHTGPVPVGGVLHASCIWRGGVHTCTPCALKVVFGDDAVMLLPKG